jgi:hypothetical protein
MILPLRFRAIKAKALMEAALSIAPTSPIASFTLLAFL